MTEAAFTKDPKILGGIPVFTGTRVPVYALIDSLEAGDTLNDFLENYPSVSNKQVIDLLDMIREQWINALVSDREFNL